MNASGGAVGPDDSGEGSRRCPSCGRLTLAGRCPPCDLAHWTRLLRQEGVRLTALVAIAVAAFWGTRALAQSNAALRRSQAAQWFAVGQEALRAGRSTAAVEALRRSAARDPARTRYRLALAEALATSHLDDEARRELLALRDAQPEDAETNLQLARVEARRGSPDAARRFYEGAIAGLWRPEQAEARRATRIELVEFLLAGDARARALSELLVLDANLPDEPALQVRVGDLFLRAGDPRRALAHFGLVLRKEPASPAALAGAGTAAFALGDYRRALRFFDPLPVDAAVAGQRELAALVLAMDPLAPRLSAAERRRRLTTAADTALEAVTDCLAATPAGDGDLDAPRRDVEALVEALGARPGRREVPAAIDDGLELVAHAQQASAARCGTPPSARARALLLIARLRGFAEP